MLIFISPSKTFTDYIESGTDLVFKDKSNNLINKIKNLNEEEIIQHYKVSNLLAKEINQYYHADQLKSKAIYRYGGVLYKALDPQSIDFNQDNKVYILSAQYGLLRHFDGINKYRLDFNHKMLGNLYNYWKNDIIEYISTTHKDEIIIDLTSKEFEPLLPKEKIRIEFELSDKKISTVLLKQMRGFFARELMNKKISTLNDLMNIEVNGFKINKDKSNKNTFTFLK